MQKPLNSIYTYKGTNMNIEDNFSKWQKWENRKSMDGLSFPGIYILCLSVPDISCQPFLWSESIIYIGMTNSKAGLSGRLKQFDNTIIGKEGHGGADRVRYKHRNYEKLINTLYISTRSFPCDITREDPEDLRIMGDVSKHEYDCFAEFKSQYSRLPEFNDKNLSKKYSLTVGRGRE